MNAHTHCNNTAPRICQHAVNEECATGSRIVLLNRNLDLKSQDVPSPLQVMCFSSVRVGAPSSPWCFAASSPTPHCFVPRPCDRTNRVSRSGRNEMSRIIFASSQASCSKIPPAEWRLPHPGLVRSPFHTGVKVQIGYTIGSKRHRRHGACCPVLRCRHRLTAQQGLYSRHSVLGQSKDQ